MTIRAFLHGAPAPIINALRKLREGSLRLLSFIEPSDGRGDTPRPPLWLRRHTGMPSAIDRAAAGTIWIIRSQQLVKSGDHVLDLGCGYGVMAPRLGDLFGPTGSYLGVDAHAPSIRWASRNLGIGVNDRRYRFATLEIRDDTSHVPVESGTIDFVLAKSVFTHLTPERARGALREIKRVLARPHGKALVTAFLFDSASPPVVAFPYTEGDPRIRWSVRVRPQAAIGFDKSLMETMISEAGLVSLGFLASFWPGRDAMDAQDVLILGQQETV